MIFLDGFFTGIFFSIIAIHGYLNVYTFGHLFFHVIIIYFLLKIGLKEVKRESSKD